MITWHRITINVTSEKEKELAEFGIRLKPGFRVFRIRESDQRWPIIATKLSQWDAGNYLETEFSESEFAGARWLELMPEWHHGYPQPEDGFAFRNITYRLGSVCRTCGVGGIQVAPFRFTREPQWGRRHILQLNWIFDEFFVRPDVYEQVFKSEGIRSMDAVKNRNGQALQTVVQIRVEQIVNTRVPEQMEPAECSECGRSKYRPSGHGVFPPLEDEPSAHIVKSREGFGSGHSAFRAVLISSALYSKIRQAGIKGVTFRPVDLK